MACTVVGLKHPYLPFFVFWYSVLCLRTVFGPLHGCGRSEPIGSHGLREWDEDFRPIRSLARSGRTGVARDCSRLGNRYAAQSVGQPNSLSDRNPLYYIAGGSGHSREEDRQSPNSVYCFLQCGPVCGRSEASIILLLPQRPKPLSTPTVMPLS